MKSESLLSIKGLAIGSPKPVAININLEVGAREFVTIMGENGSGKTTLFDCLLSALEPMQGEIQIGGLPNSGSMRKLVNQMVGWVSSQIEAYPHALSCADFLNAISKLYPQWDSLFCEKLTKDFELDLTKKLSHLSLGEHSKIRLLKALSYKPKLLVLDELTANLSPSSKEAILKALIDLFSEGRTSVVYFSHASEEALRLSDRIYTLSKTGLRLTGGLNA